MKFFWVSCKRSILNIDWSGTDGGDPKVTWNSLWGWYVLVRMGYFEVLRCEIKFSYYYYRTHKGKS
jgi:hypothetical protein